MKEPNRPKRHRNAAEKRALKAGAVRLFVKQVGRRAQKGADPNDRRHDPKVERRIKKMQPDQFDALLGNDEEG
jgi:hypothetical protein